MRVSPEHCRPVLRRIALNLGIAALLAAWTVSVEVSAQPLGFENPILSGFYPDPSICRVGDDYYLVTSSFEYFPGVPIFHSQDLMHWRQLGHVLSRKSQLPLEKMRASGGIFAPTLRHHESTFYLVTTNVWGGGNFYVTAEDPAGPWSEPVWLDQQGIDPSLFFDDEGTVYYTRHVGGGDGFIGQCTLNLETGKLEGELRNIWEGTGDVWAEGPHLYKMDGSFYLMISEGGTSYDHMVTIARSDSPWGPFESCPDNPILSHRDQPEHPFQAIGHADLVNTPAGWWMVCLGIRPQGGRFHHLGRETFLTRLDWNERNWPVVNQGRGVEPVMQAPNLKPSPEQSTTGRDDFDTQQLDFCWNFVRNPYERDWSLTERPGYLRLNGSSVTPDDVDSPAFVGRRQTALAATVTAALEFQPQAENEEAGLLLRGNDANYALLGITLRDGRRQSFLRVVQQGETVEPVNYADVPAGPVVLRIDARPLEYTFSFQNVDSELRKLGTARTQDFSSEKIGGFTGVYLGMCATGNGQSCSTPADFDWFEFNELER